MKNFGKILVLILALSLLILALALTASAKDESETLTIITVGETTNPDTKAPYTLEEAWAKSKALGKDKVEVILKTNNDTFESDFAKVSVSGWKTVLQLTTDVKTTKKLTTTKGATVIIDVSGYTLDVAYRFTLSGNSAKLVFRTSSAAGKVLCSNTSSNEGLFSAVSANQNATISFVSANNEDKLLTAECNNYLITFGNATAGTSNIEFNGGAYKTQPSYAILSLNSGAKVAPSTLKVSAQDASFLVGCGFLQHNQSTSYEANVGAFGVDSSISLERCTFAPVGESTINFVYDKGTSYRLKGRYFGTLTLTDCAFTKISPNFNVMYTYVTATTDENGETVYDSNYPLAKGDGTYTFGANLGYDYRPEAVAAGYDGTNRVFFHGVNTFDGITAGHVSSDRTSFNASNVTLGDDIIFYATTAKTSVFVGDGLISDEADLLAYVNLTSEYGVALKTSLTNDIENTVGITFKPAGNLTLDLKGHTLAMTHTASTSRFYVRGKLHIYSSEAGGKITSASSLSMFFMSESYSPVLTLGREEDKRENLTIESKAGFIVFSNTFNGATARCTVTNATMTTEKYFIKLNAKATAESKPTVEFDFKGCDIRIAYKGFLAYNENEILNTDKTSTNNGIIAYGSYVNVDGCTISRATNDSNMLFSSENRKREEGGASIPTFQGAFFGTVTFKNTHFKNILLNFEYITSTKENKLLNGKNEEYSVPDEWDVTKQVTLLEGCTFDMDAQRGIHANGNAFTYASNVTIQDGFVLARTGEEDTFALLPQAETVTLTWELTDKSIVVSYQKGAPIYAPALDSYAKTVNGNRYTLAYSTKVPPTAVENATFRTRYTGGATLSANYSLDTAIHFHAYVPATDEILAVNGVPRDDLKIHTVNDTDYFMISFPDLAPKDAYKSKCVSLNVSLGDEVVTVDRYISLVGYAEAALRSNLDEKTVSLVLSTMDYINKANIYFGGESVARIDALLCENGFTAYTWEASNVKTLGEYENLRGARLDLNQTPGFVFYVRADYEGAITVNGVSYTDFSETVTIDGAALKYVVVEVPAYKMANDLTVTAGEDTLVYNLDTYIAQKAANEPYAHALYGYVMAAKAYLL